MPSPVGERSRRGGGIFLIDALSPRGEGPQRRRNPPLRECCGRSRSGQLLLEEKRFVAAVGQALYRLLDRKPDQLVDLDPGAEAPAEHLHHPVASHLVATAAVDVSGAAKWPHQLAFET